MADDDKTTVLLVDDDDDTRDSMKRVLEKKGYRVLAADGPVAATEEARRSGAEIDVVVLDVVMPGMSGISAADKIAEEVDPLRILYVSGFISGELPERRETPGTSTFLQKPFTVEQFLGKIEALLADDAAGRDDSGG